MNSELDTYIQENVQWEDLPPHIRSSFGCSPSQWEGAVVEYSLRQQLRWKTNPVRHIIKDERAYYDRLVTQGRENLMLFPYHLSVQVIQRQKITPFKYYQSMLYELMLSEKSYDTLPNFTAIDCLRMTDVGRNQYIDHMNNCRAKKFFRTRKIRESLPSHPASLSHFEGWWVVHLGFVTEEDVKSSTPDEHKLIDLIIDQGPTAACRLEPDNIASLYTKDLIYFEIPVLETDRVSFPPLEGFVMNRVQGDAIETLLYKIFLSANDDTSVNELSSILQINAKSVRQAVSLFIRLGLAKKKNPSLPPESNFTTTKSESTDFLLIEMAKESDSIGDEAEETVSIELRQKRLGFLYDSSLTAYLMMGNLSPSLKTHAVTMFEVGKLSEENIDSFLQELGQISVLSEGEAQRYFDHAHALFNTLSLLRGSTTDTFKSLPIDLIRAESISQLDSEACQRLLSKNYHTLLVMAPLSSEAGIPCLPDGPPLMGPPSQSSSSVWFKLWLYQQLERGPPSLLLTRGTRLRTLPTIFRPFSEISCETWGHDPTVLSTNTILQSVNDTLTHTPVFLQGYSTGADTITKYISFPITQEELLALDPAIQNIIRKLSQVMDLSVSCGYITLLKIGPSRLPSFYHTSNHNDWAANGNTSELAHFQESPHVPLRQIPSIEETIIVSTASNTPNSLTDPVTPQSVPLAPPISPQQSQTSAQNLAENFLKELDELKLFEESSPLEYASDTVSLGPSETDTKSLEIPSLVPTQRKEADTLFSEWVLLDVSFGIPLFNIDLNKKVCHDLLRSDLLEPSNLVINSAQSQRIAAQLQTFIEKCTSQTTVQSWTHCSRSVLATNHVSHPTKCVGFSDSDLSFFTP